MIVGVIKTKDLIFHPSLVIAVQGFRGFLRLLLKACSRQKYPFLSLIPLGSDSHRSPKFSLN